MSRKIDLSKPLSDEDREYLESRSRLDLIARNDEEFGREPEAPVLAPAEDGAQQENLKVEEDVVEDDYSDMTNEELREELSERGLSTTGNKAELLARLREDDAS